MFYANTVLSSVLVFPDGGKQRENLIIIIRYITEKGVMLHTELWYIGFVLRHFRGCASWLGIGWWRFIMLT